MITEMLLREYDSEMKNTRKLLERVPYDKSGYKPHAKSMAIEKLASHVAELPGFGLTIVTSPSFDFGAGGKREQPEFSEGKMLKFFDEIAGKCRSGLANVKEEDWKTDWALSFKGQKVFSGSRFEAYRAMFMNHLIHHRAQLGVYLRLNDKPLPATYGPSADDSMGF